MAFVLAKSLTLTRTTSIPLSSDAFNSKVFCLHVSPKSCLAITKDNVVFPIPAGPAKRRCGRFFCSTNAFIFSTMSCCPLISANVEGRYFSVHIADSILTLEYGYFISFIVVGTYLVLHQK